MAAHQAPLSLGFSRQEHWSGLPFPSPMHESEKWKWSRSFVSDSSRPHGLQPTRLLHPWDFPGKSTGVGCHCLLWGTMLSKSLIQFSVDGWDFVSSLYFVLRPNYGKDNGHNGNILQKGLCQHALALRTFYLNGLVVFSTFFNLSQNFAIRSSWSEP